MSTCPEVVPCGTGEPGEIVCPPLPEPKDPPCCGKVDIPDGVYTTITLKGGCPVGYGTHESPAYTPPLCCDSETTIVTNPGGDVTISGEACNLLRDDNGLIVTPTYATGTNQGNVLVTGCGTDSDPYILNYEGDGSETGLTWTNTTNAVLDISGSGTSTSPLVIGHGTKQPGIVDSSLQVDIYGHVISFNPPDDLGFGVLPPLQMNTVGGAMVLSIDNTTTGTYSSPWGTLSISNGLIVGFTPATTSISPGTFETADGKTVTYNGFGLITGVV